MDDKNLQSDLYKLLLRDNGKMMTPREAAKSLGIDGNFDFRPKFETPEPNEPMDAMSAGTVTHTYTPASDPFAPPLTVQEMGTAKKYTYADTAPPDSQAKKEAAIKSQAKLNSLGVPVKSPLGDRESRGIVPIKILHRGGQRVLFYGDGIYMCTCTGDAHPCEHVIDVVKAGEDKMRIRHDAVTGLDILVSRTIEPLTTDTFIVPVFKDTFAVMAQMFEKENPYLKGIGFKCFRPLAKGGPPRSDIGAFVSPEIDMIDLRYDARLEVRRIMIDFVTSVPTQCTHIRHDKIMEGADYPFQIHYKSHIRSINGTVIQNYMMHVTGWCAACILYEAEQVPDVDDIAF